MSQLKTSVSLSAEKTSIHDMLKDTPPLDRSTNTNVSASAANSSCPYTRSIPTSLPTCTSSPAILTPSSPTQNEDSTILKTSSRIENIKNWSISTYKCTKQIMFEKLGKSSRTVDAGVF
uniref:Arfaptin-2 n=1 Tax=Anoplophora glabripennis TaxID=217634 RepID=V5GKV5_ANOGL